MATISQRIVPNFWFDRDAEEAGAFYASIFANTTFAVGARYPNELPDWQASFAGAALTVDVVIDGFQITLFNAGPQFRPNPSLSLMLGFDPKRYDNDEAATRSKIDATWAALAEGGNVLMPLEEYPFSKHYGWVEDKYGISWQLLLTGADSEAGPFVVPELLFSGDVQNKAREAADFYASLFTDGQVGFMAEYPEPTGPAEAGSVMFGEVRLASQWFAVMDSGSDPAHPFTCGGSLEVRCSDQTEIDRLWHALSAVPEAEQCGWLADKYGVSWQIVPENMVELLERPGAYERMLEMKKLIIANF